MAERKGIQLCYPFDEKRLNRWRLPYIVQPKLDGERCRAKIYGKGYLYNTFDKVVLLSSSEQEITSVPHINEELLKFAIPGKMIELDGELYNHHLSFEEISSRVSRTVNIHPESEDIYYHVFDQVNNYPQWERLLQLKVMLKSAPEHIVKVPERIGIDLDEVMEIYNFILACGFEGIVVRNFFSLYERKRSTNVMKFKPKKDDFYKIVGWEQMIDKNGLAKEMLGALVLTSDEGTIFSVGSGMTDEFRRRWWPKEEATKLLGRICHIQYQHLTTGKIPRFPVFVEVIEI